MSLLGPEQPALLSIADIETSMIAFLEETPREADDFLSGYDVTGEAAKELLEGFIKYLKN
jgi:hypothetical protein